MSPLLQIALQETPQAIELLKTLFKKAHPELPEPTSAQVMAAWSVAFATSLAKDDAILAAHPNA